MGVLEDRVVLVTGGGNGIGRACALAAAAEGAAVVVNDVGGSVTGSDDGTADAAELVAEEIRKAGGRAVSNCDSIVDYDAVVGMRDQALDAFGALHGVINPAGILRDGMLHKMSPDNFKAVLDVHLIGAFNVCRATIEHFREQRDGAYCLFTSTSGLIGNPGQANYAAAKLGVHGLSHVIAMENASRNIRANVIAPFAWTRMVASIPITDDAALRRAKLFEAKMRPDQVAQLAIALVAPDASHVSGEIFSARGNEIFLFSQPRPLRGVSRDEWTPRTILDSAIPALESAFVGLQSNVFPWDPV